MTNLDKQFQDGETYLQTNDPELESEQSRSEVQVEPAATKKLKKQKVRYTQIGNIVDTFRDLVKLGNKRKQSFFKYRKEDVAGFRYKKYKRLSNKIKITPGKTDQLYSAELEMTTITSLREMYFNRPKTLKEIEEIKIGKEPTTEVFSPNGIFKHYLNKYKQRKLDELFVKIPRKGSSKSENKQKYAKIKKSRDTIRNGYVVSVFNIDDDNLFTDHELFKIHKMKKDKRFFKEQSDQNKVMYTKEVWDWDEFGNYVPYFTGTNDASTITESSYVADEEPIPKPETMQRMKHYLVNWFQRESPVEEIQATFHKFQFHENRYPRRCTFFTENSRMNAAIKFLKFAKIVYPDLECMKILTELRSYIGPVTLDHLRAQTRTIGSILTQPTHKLRYFRKLLKETKELENLFVAPKIKTDAEDDVLKEERIKPDMLQQNEENLKNNLENNHLSNIYDEYVESCLPSPFNEIFISIANGLMKYNIYISSDPKSKEYKYEMAELIGRILKLVLESMNWVTDTIFRTSAPFDFSEERDTEKETAINAVEEDRATDISINGMDLAIKKIMVYLIKFTNLNHIFHKKYPDVSSEECESMSYTSAEEEKNTVKR